MQALGEAVAFDKKFQDLWITDPETAETSLANNEQPIKAIIVARLQAGAYRGEVLQDGRPFRRQLVKKKLDAKKFYV